MIPHDDRFILSPFLYLILHHSFSDKDDQKTSTARLHLIARESCFLVKRVLFE